MTTGPGQAPRAMEPGQRLTIAVTGPTGDIGRSLLRALEQSDEVARVLALARRPFDPAAHGLTKTEYRQGDVLDRQAIDDLVDGVDVVVHLAFVIMGGLDETQRVNLEGSRNVFEAAVATGAQRLVYASSVAAYGFHEDNPAMLTEDIPARGSDRHYYSAQKAELEDAFNQVVEGSDTQGYVFRPCIVAGRDALAMVRSIPYIELLERLREGRLPLADTLSEALSRFPGIKPVIPDPGVPFQLVHHDDVAAALRAGLLGRGAPGVYNLAGPGQLTMSDLARELGWYAVPIPRAALDSAAELIARLPMVPTQAQWIEALREPVLMDTTKAQRELGWKPAHDAEATLREMVAAARGEGLV
jgi:UDP-glucose 4-epimerase